MDAITTADAWAFRTALAARVSPATVNNVLSISRMIWADAMEDSVCRENPFAGKKILLKVDRTS